MPSRAVPVLHRIKCTVDSTQVPVANAFCVAEWIFVEATFPKPLAVVVAWIGKVFHVQIKRPRCFWIGNFFFAFVPRPHVAHPHAALGSLLPVSAGEKSDRAVARAINEQRATDFFLFAGSRVEGVDRRHAFVFSVDFESVVVEEQVDIGFRANDFFFLGIAKLFVGPWRFFGLVGELFNHLSDARVFAAANVAHGPNANFARPVSAEY